MRILRGWWIFVVHVPQKFGHLQDIRDNDEKVAAYGVELATEMCQKILDSGQYGLHFYTQTEKTSRKIYRTNLLENVSTRRELFGNQELIPMREPGQFF